MGASHRGVDKNVPLGSQANLSSPIEIPSSPAAEVAGLIEDYAYGGEDRVAEVSSPICRRQIDFADEPYVPEAPQILIQEEL